MYVNFTKVVFENVKGDKQEANFAEELGNQLYMTGRHITECELGKRIFHAKGEMELSEKEIEIVKNAVAGWSYIARTAIESAMTEKKE